MKLTKTMEKMGRVPFEMDIPLYLLIMIVYIIFIPIWLPIYLVAKWVEIYKENEDIN